MKLLVLGGTGMLGSMVAKLAPAEWEITVTARSKAPYPYEVQNGHWRWLDILPADSMWLVELASLAEGVDCIINCLGATKPLMGTAGARIANRILPQHLDGLAPCVIHPSTDCVFSGTAGLYTETDQPDADDDYGLSKARGDEAGLFTLRCSLIGPECHYPARHLYGTVLEERISNGYTDHLWNGVTTLAWAKLALAIAQDPGLQPAATDVSLFHVTPRGVCSKDRLVSTILQSHGRHNVELHGMPSGTPVDRTLATNHPAMDYLLWLAAGYSPPPTIEQMVWELADFCRAEHWPPTEHGWRYWRHN